MFPSSLRARLRRRASSFFGREEFKARSPERDASTDLARIRSILSAVCEALRAAEQERAGLKTRLEDVSAMASMSVGYSVDEYIDREAHKANALNYFDSEIIR